MKQRRFAPLPVLLVAFVLLGGLLIPTFDALAATKTTKKTTTTKKAASKSAPKTKFTLALDTAVLTVPRGSGATATVLLTRNGTFTAPVSLSATARRGLTFTFDDNPLVGDDTDVTVSATPTATLGSTTITVTGKSGSTAVKLLVRVKVVAALAPGVTTTTAAPVAVAPTAPTTAAPSVVATTTVPGATTTVASTTTTQPGVTTTTAPGVTTSTTAPAAAAATTTSTTRFTFSGSATITPSKLGDLVVVRRLSQTPRCNVDVTVSGPDVSFSVQAESSDAHISFVAVNSCTEQGKTDPTLLVKAGTGRGLLIPAGMLVIVRGTGAGTPIRRVIRVTAAMDKVVALGDTLTLFMSCNPPPGPPGSPAVPPNSPFVVSLAAQGQFVLNDVPAGQYCAVSPLSTYTYAGAAEDTTEPIGDSFVVVPERTSSSCPKATLTTPIPGPVGCYAEMVITN